METFVDMLSHRAGTDPIELRRGLLSAHPRHLAVLEKAIEESDWGAPIEALGPWFRHE